MTWWKYLLVVAALASWLAGLLLAYVSSLADWPLLYIWGACLLALLFLALRAVVRGGWRELAIVSLPLVMMTLPAFGLPLPADWLQAVGFRIYASPVESYLSRCRLYDFIDDDGTKQRIGQCHSVRRAFDERVTVVYDTTGQFGLPLERRTSAWQSAVSRHLSAGMFLARNNDGWSHIFGNFYAVFVALPREDGNDGR